MTPKTSVLIWLPAIRRLARSMRLDDNCVEPDDLVNAGVTEALRLSAKPKTWGEVQPRIRDAMLTLVRKRRRNALLDDSLDDEADYCLTDDPEDDMIRNMDLRDAAEHLTPEQNEVLQAYYGEGKTLFEVSQTCSRSYISIWERHNRALCKLRAVLTA